MKHPCHETWSAFAGNLTGWRAPLLQRCRAGRWGCHPAGVQQWNLAAKFPSHGKWCVPWGFLKYDPMGPPNPIKSWDLVSLVVISWVFSRVSGEKPSENLQPSEKHLIIWGSWRLSWWSSDPFARSALEILWLGASAPVPGCARNIFESWLTDIVMNRYE